MKLLKVVLSCLVLLSATQVQAHYTNNVEKRVFDHFCTNTVTGVRTRVLYSDSICPAGTTPTHVQYDTVLKKEPVVVPVGPVFPVTNCAKMAANKPIVDIKTKGAIASDGIDDSQAIQAAIVESSDVLGTAYIPAGTWDVTANIIKAVTNTTIVLDKDAILKLKATNLANYSVIEIKDVFNVNISGGSIVADRAIHTGTTGEWGMGINILNSSNVNIENLVVRDAWGDGFYVGSTSSNVQFCKVTADNARRNGMSITSANTVLVDDSTFSNTKGTLPQSGLGLEPNANELVTNITIKNSKFFNNYASGFYAGWVTSAVGASITNVVLDSNNIYNNGLGTSTFAYGILLDQQVGVKVLNNTITGNKHAGIYLDSTTRDTFLTGNTITGNDKLGIVLDNTVSGTLADTNIVSGHTTYDIVNWSAGTGNVFRNNTAIAPAVIKLGGITQQ